MRDRESLRYIKHERMATRVLALVGWLVYRIAENIRMKYLDSEWS